MDAVPLDMDSKSATAELRAVHCPGSLSLTPQQANAAMKELQQKLPKTQLVQAWPSCVPGLVALRLASGEVAYTDKSGRYLLLGLVFDSATGQALDRQLDSQPLN